ncbi:family 16 glycosylhydrolase [Nonomuraea sp. NN258]|uniref:family 16 glycosylhydrolase n=1 Tax=Nonomuraea antri TaxID=2730852 RepID=UPI00156A5B60|nr:family 16 glycosylhydrolase [Nonomuraea antri]NRQ36832.1 family 16 glycosylhydrolase [Nonomuraea antri]
MRVLLTLMLLLALAGCAGQGPREQFRDDFDGTALNAEDWLYDLGTCYPGCPAPQWGTGEIETMTDRPENVSVGGGHLSITPRLDAGRWTSARIETRRADFAVPKGGTLRVEARIALPAVSQADGAGYWPAFWMLGGKLRDGYTGWPGIGEIDILEAVNGRPAVSAAMHCGTFPGGPCQEPKGIGSGEHPCPACHGSFHTYAVELTERQARWYLDGKPYFTVESTGMDAATWQRATGHGGFFLILNVAIGGGLPQAFGGGPTAATVPGRPMLVDYVSVSTTGG